MIVKREINLLQIQSISFLNNQKCLFFQFQDRVEDLKRERNLLKGNHDRLLKNMLNSSNQPHWSTDLMKERLQQRVSHLQEQLDSEVAEKRKILFQLAKEQAENVDLKEEVTQMLIKHKKEVELLRQKNTTTTTTSSQSDPDFLQPSHQDYTKETQTYEVNSLLEIQEEEKNLTRAYDQMKAAHAETALELEKTRDMLLVQQQINKRYQDELEIVKTKADNNEREHKEEWEKLNQLLDLKNNRIQQLEGNFNLNDPVGKPNGSIELKLEWESHYLSPEDLLNSATHSVENDNKAPLSVENYNEVPLSVEKHNEANLQVEDYNETLPSVENKETDLHIEHYNEAPLSVENSEAPLSAKKYNEANLSVEDYNEADLSMESYNEMNLQIEDYEGSLPIENYKVNSSIENNDKVKPSKENCDEARLSIEDFSEAKLSIENFDEAKLFIENLDETKLSTENCEETKQSIENFEEAKLSAENCDETKLSVKNFEEATLSIENCEEDRLPIENCEEDRLPIENCDEDKLSIENSDETTPSIENCDEAKQSIENFEETKLAIENCNEDKLSVENFEEDKLPVENCNEDKLSIENGSEMHLLVEDYNKAPELIENFNEKPIEIPEEENILFHQVNEKKLLGATDDAKKDPEECYPEVKQQEQESPFPDTDYQPSEQADEISETQTTDSDDVIVTPLSHKGPKTNSDKICIEIVSLAFDPEAKVMSDESIQQVYVEYRFHDLPLSETETPVSLRKPRAGEDIHFHFNKVIDLNPVEHGDRRKFLFSMLQEKNPEQRQLKFIVVSDPEEQKNECQEVGYAYLELWQILDTGRDILEQEIDIINSQDKATSIGKLKVSLQATDALQAIFKEMNEDTHL
ncbi:X-linked retinitis pigmentosa GTPase regulator-interacting protein 1 isoform X2 [Petaurus breviceps papuanus]|uniref:X-linked retinitis pigmentosa GTPase regulator-interacting protein 1 isoform X2 n=1 Tax=Petaurus breviceps papuanus TaxID=3040969 RepID=UPI0036D86D6D